VLTVAGRVFCNYDEHVAARGLAVIQVAGFDVALQPLSVARVGKISDIDYPGELTKFSIDLETMYSFSSV